MGKNIYKGNVNINKNNRVSWEEKLKDIDEISGDFSIYAQAKLDNLKTVGGDLSIGAQAELDNLKTVGGDLSIYARAKLEAPNLETVEGDLYK
ncbi:MAG: hypothetical protein ABIG95_02585 [Candidatus Woesearchaeota archaeon]